MPILSNVVVTAYCACAICCGPGGPKPTASGKWPRQGVTVAAPRWLPLNTPVQIELAGGWKQFLAQDRTAKHFNGRFDVYFDDHQAAKNFGVRRCRVLIPETPTKKKR